MKLFRRFFQAIEQKKQRKLMIVMQLIQDFYILKQKWNVPPIGTVEKIYASARAELINLGITRVDLKGNIIIITLMRPGMLIGRYGDNINALTTFLKSYKIEIIEEKNLSFLLPYVPDIGDLDWLDD